MNIHQFPTPARPQAADQPPEQPPEQDGFTMLVEDILTSLEKDQDITTAMAVQAIADAYRPRIAIAHRRADEAKMGMAAYAAMDRSQQAILESVKRVVAENAENNARKAAYISYLSDVRRDVRALITQAAERSSTTVDLADLRQAVEGAGMFNTRMKRPVPVALAVDTRWTHGMFHREGADFALPFIGWSMVVHSVFVDSLLEPTFLGEEGYPVTSSQLSGAGIYLIHLQ